VAARTKEALERLVKLYEDWDAAEPGRGYADLAAAYCLLLPQPWESAVESPP